MNLKKILFLSLLTTLTNCSDARDEYLYKVIDEEFDQIGVKSGYVDSNGDTVIEMGKYYYCYTDTLRNYAIVMEHGGSLIAIDKDETKLFDVFWYDNGPDYINEGLFRIKKNDKIGYANEEGEIVIVPRFDCASSFENGLAKVSNSCTLKKVGEHEEIEWIDFNLIDKDGRIVQSWD